LRDPFAKKLWSCRNPAVVTATDRMEIAQLLSVTPEPKCDTRFSLLSCALLKAISRVEIRPRITGFLDEVLFKEGDLIKAGAPIYRIEKELFQAQIEQAVGALEQSKPRNGMTY
jgi:hypothetical protein